MKVREAISKQQEIFDEICPDKVIESDGERRNLYGRVAESVVCHTLDLFPIGIDTQFDLCFDAEGCDGTFYEIKSVKRGGQVCIYKWRLEKESICGKRVRYVIATHQVQKAYTLADVWRGFSETCAEIYVVPIGVVQNACEQSRTRGHAKPNGRPSYGGRRGYTEGYYAISMRKFSERLHHKRQATFRLHGLQFNITIKELL